MGATKEQTGLTIARSGWKYTFSWKLGEESYAGGQALQWHTTPGKWQTVTIGNAATTKSVTLPAADWYPTTSKKLQSITFRVRGKKTAADSWSAWAEKTMTLSVPVTPTVSAELLASNQTKFTFTVNPDTTDKRPYTSMQWQSMLVKACSTANGADLTWTTSALGWAAGTPTTSSYTTRTEDSTILAQDSYTRWFRIRSRGVCGFSAWRYSRHVYATPYKPKVNTAKATESGASTTILMTWTAVSSASHPIDYAEAQYMIATPAANMAAPSGSWTVGSTVKDTGGTDGAAFLINEQVGTDQCLWVRVAAYHDENVSVSDPYLVSAGELAAPTGLSVTTNTSTYQATVSFTNESDVPDSRIAVVFQEKDSEPFVVGIAAHSASSITVQCPTWTGAVAFGVYAFQGGATYTTTSGVNRYTIEANAISETVWDGGAVPLAPSTVTAETTETAGEVLVTWSCDWTSANCAEISWSTNPNAWESTNQPSKFEISNTFSSHWRVSGLTEGAVYFFKVRLGVSANGDITYSPYSEAVMVDLSSAPAAPVLSVSSAVIPEDGSVTASWSYVSTDGTAQTAAEVREVTISGATTIYNDVVALGTTEQSVEIYAADAGWTTGGSYYIAVRVTSESGHISAWSDPMPVIIADPISINIASTSLTSVTLDDGSSSTRTVTALTDMPMTATVTGAGAGGTTTVVIERADTYVMERPDESNIIGYEGETVYIFTQTGEEAITIETADLIGRLDDGAPYRFIATVQDTYGQSATNSIEFEVHWTNQAVVPDGTAVISGTYAIITPVAPAGYIEGDTCDVYRLSADKPVMVLEDASFGTAYADPYPAVGDTGGYRFVYKTANGDYITADNALAWLDVEAGLDEDATIIDFGSDQVTLKHNMAVSHSWSKDFTETTYLGGSIQGDWNNSVHRSSSVSSDVVTDDPDLIASMRRLAAYTNICHVRTVDGSSFAADVQVSESRSYEQGGQIAAFSVTIQEVAPQELDGILYSEWVS